MNKKKAIELIEKGLFEEVEAIYWKDRDIVKKAIEGVAIFVDDKLEDDKQ